jgi:hypothetical protein
MEVYLKRHEQGSVCNLKSYKTSSMHEKRKLNSKKEYKTDMKRLRHMDLENE